MKIARVFPRKTKASPDDALAFFGPPPRLGLPEIVEVHISVAFTYDMDIAEELAYQWEDVQETREYKGLPWRVHGNPWVWVTEFERVSKEEAENARN